MAGTVRIRVYRWVGVITDAGLSLKNDTALLYLFRKCNINCALNMHAYKICIVYFNMWVSYRSTFCFWGQPC